MGQDRRTVRPWFRPIRRESMFERLMLVIVLAFPVITSRADGASKLLVLGDSLTEGYGIDREASFPALLQSHLVKAGQKDLLVVNGGVSGSTTAGGLARLAWLLKGNPTHVIVALGANDGLRGLKLEDSEKNLDLIISACQGQKIKVMLVGMKIPPNYGKDYTDRFEAIYPRLAKKYHIPFIPFLLEGVAGQQKLNLSDGIHPNEAGHLVIATNLFKPVLEFIGG